jgi:hypothetical protein
VLRGSLPSSTYRSTKALIARTICRTINTMTMVSVLTMIVASFQRRCIAERPATMLQDNSPVNIFLSCNNYRAFVSARSDPKPECVPLFSKRPASRGDIS